ncbi:MAG: DNA-protecting protein DprA [Chloroflexi bacterium]|nr:DNA-protecting protein DprA [Chloroflexota bacterium]
MHADTKYAVALHKVPGFGRVRFGLLEQRFGSLEDAWHARDTALRSSGLDAKALEALLQARPRISPDAEIERLEHFQTQALTIHDDGYPKCLKEIYDPPPVLYIRGSLIPDEWYVTIVGTRGITAYGREVAIRLASDLARSKVTVASGLARGVDAVAHQAALDVGGRTIAVQACGLDMVYPPSHASLARRIVEQGALVSDYPLGTKPRPEFFPRRNRILAGLALGTLVIEAPESSGALITAKFALEENREVFAVPGSILSPASVGTNRLIQAGAKAVLVVADILEELNLQATTTSTPAQQLPLGLAPAAADGPESVLLQHLSLEPLHIDEVRRVAGLPMSEVSSVLALLELKGLIRQTSPLTYVLAQMISPSPVRGRGSG